MAGTRLVIQLAFVVELVLLLALNFYFGLCRTSDLLCVPLAGQGGRSQLVIPQGWENRMLATEERQTALPVKRYSLQVTLVLENGSDWSGWAQALDQWLQQTGFSQETTCLRGPVQTQVSFDGQLSQNARAVVNNVNATEYHVSSTQVQQWLESHGAQRHSGSSRRRQVMLYVPIKLPLLVTNKGQKPATALTWDQRLVTIVQQDEDLNVAVQQAMSFCKSYLQCPTSTLALKLLVQDTLEQAKENVVISRNILAQSSYKVAITQEVSQQWMRSMELVDWGLQDARNGDYVSALQRLEESLEQSQALLTNPALMEPLDFPRDHYLAILAPLLFPLLLPFCAGLIREAKRYKKLKQNKL